VRSGPVVGIFPAADFSAKETALEENDALLAFLASRVRLSILAAISRDGGAILQSTSNRGAVSQQFGCRYGTTP
jgi:hypothetical protein